MLIPFFETKKTTPPPPPYKEPKVGFICPKWVATYHLRSLKDGTLP